MENIQQTMNQETMKIEIPAAVGENITTTTSPGRPPAAGGFGGGGLTRQSSISKNGNCLCSPTTHVGSFRCRLHRSPTSPAPALQRTKSIEAARFLQDPLAKPSDSSSGTSN